MGHVPLLLLPKFPSVSSDSAVSVSLPRVYVKPRRALPFFGRHPWVFQGAVQKVAGDPEPGAEVALVTDREEFIARGLYNPDSNIVVRLYSWEEAAPLDEAFWQKRLAEAIRLRTGVLGWNAPEGACRLVYSEADGLSGLIVDRYRDWLLVQFTSRALAARSEMIVRLLQAELNPAGIWLRTEKGIREAEGLSLHDGPLAGGEPPRPLFVEENGLRFGIDIVEGQKTGFFLDQRENRAASARYITHGRVLDCFSYTGGFALNFARKPDVREVLCVDASEPALALARANAELNGLGQKLRFEKADAFTHIGQLKEQGERFNAIVLDPPKLARHRKSVPDALRGYHRLNRAALDLLEPDGILVTCSCSGHVNREMFETMLSEVAGESGRRLQILESRGASPDHPISVQCLENNYLKCCICRAV